MQILPIVNKDRILHVQVSIKNIKKREEDVNYKNTLESDIIVNNSFYSKSAYKDDKDILSSVNFIRNASINFPRSYYVTTKVNNDSPLYDVYEIPQIPLKVNEACDLLYANCLTNLRTTIPGYERGRYLSFDKIGLAGDISDEEVDKIKYIVENSNGNLYEELKEKGLGYILDILDFLNNFDCVVVKHTTIAENDLKNIILKLEPLNTRESRNLISYYKMALSNRDIYGKLSYINKLIYGEPLSLIRSDAQRERQKVKTSREVELNNEF